MHCRRPGDIDVVYDLFGTSFLALTRRWTEMAPLVCGALLRIGFGLGERKRCDRRADQGDEKQAEGIHL